MPKAFFIDTSRCTACRGCQIACKEWNELPANATKQRGSHQNPPDLNPNNYKVVRFNEHLDGKTVQWYFFPDQCRHCLDPPCKGEADGYVKEAIVRDEATGAVLFTPKTKELTPDAFEAVRQACPYNVPRRNPKTGLLAKCTMCHERIVKGMQPACVKACPTGTMSFGERGDMLALAKKRIEQLKAVYPNAVLADAESVGAIYLLMDNPKKYHEFAVASATQGLDRQQFLGRLFAPLARSARALARV
jgi:formate dehydrogenase iron-sulfur subunit